MLVPEIHQLCKSALWSIFLSNGAYLIKVDGQSQSNKERIKKLYHPSMWESENSKPYPFLQTSLHLANLNLIQSLMLCSLYIRCLKSNRKAYWPLQILQYYTSSTLLYFSSKLDEEETSIYVLTIRISHRPRERDHILSMAIRVAIFCYNFYANHVLLIGQFLLAPCRLVPNRFISELNLNQTGSMFWQFWIKPKIGPYGSILILGNWDCNRWFQFGSKPAKKKKKIKTQIGSMVEWLAL